MNISRVCYCPWLKRMQLTRTAFVWSPNTRVDSWETSILPLKIVSLHHSITWSFLFYNKTKVQSMHISNHIEHYSIKLYCVTCTKHDCTSVHCIFNWNTSVTDHKQGTVGFPQRKPPPKTIANSTVIVCSLVSVVACVNILIDPCSRNDLKVINKLVFPCSLTLQLNTLQNVHSKLDRYTGYLGWGFGVLRPSITSAEYLPHIFNVWFISYRTFDVPNQCCSNGFAGGPPLASKNNHRSSHPFSCKHTVSEW
jgi:hypothetical protein